MPRRQGIYHITHRETGQVYVGSSVDIARRWTDHRRELRLGIHKNVLLQAAYDTGGLDVLLYTVLEDVALAEDLVRLEQKHLDLLRPFYNGHSIAVRAPYRTWRNDTADKVRFWNKVNQAEEGCWLWQGMLLTQGYGCFKIAGKMLKAHRIAYTYAYGSIPEDLVICHTCDSPRCVKPVHLFAGTHKDNSADMMAKGRGYANNPARKKRTVPLERHGSQLHPEMRRGERNGRAVLSPQQVEDIRRKYAQGGVSQFVLSEEYQVAQITISAVVRRKNWNYQRSRRLTWFKEN